MAASLSVIRVYGESLRLWRRHFVRLTILACCLELPILVAELLLHVGTGFTFDSRRTLAANSAAVPLAIYGSLSHHFLSGLIEKLVGAERHGHANPTLREIVHELPWLRLLGADLLMTLLVVIGYLLLVVPGVLLATWLTPLLVIVNLERRPVRASMVRSYQLVRGHFWRVFVVGILALLLVQIGVQAVLSVAEIFSHARPIELLAHAVPATLLMPIAALPIVVLTFDLVALAGPPPGGAHEPARAPRTTAGTEPSAPEPASGVVEASGVRPFAGPRTERSS